MYFQPPESIKLKFPCIIYHKTGTHRVYSDNMLYLKKQKYQLTVVDEDPDSVIADDIVDAFEYCYITNYYNKDGLNHTTLTLNY